jgi:hypothetical protein
VWGDDVARFFQKTDEIKTDKGSRTVEAFHWGRFTSGSATRTMWLLLLPFALINLSRYMLLGDRAVPKALLRFLGLVLTSLLVSNVVYMSLELVVRQCTTNDKCRKGNSWLGFMESWGFGWRLLLGMVPVLLVILLLWWFGRQTFLYAPKPADSTPEPGGGPMRNPAFWSNAPRTRVLRDLHVAAACATAGVMHGGMLKTGPDRDTVWERPWLGALSFGIILLALAVAGVWYEPPLQTNASPPAEDRLHRPAQVLKWSSLVYLGVASGIAICFFLRESSGQNPTVAPLAGFEFVTMVQTGLMGVLLVLLFSWCWWSRNEQDDVHRAFKPMWFGFGAFLVAAFAATLATGFSGGFAYRLADLLGKPVGKLSDSTNETEHQIELSAAYWGGVVLWGWLAVAFLVALLPLLAALIYRVNAVWALLPGALCVVCAVVFGDARSWFVYSAVALLAIGVGMCGLHLFREKLDQLVRKDYENESDEGIVVSTDDKAEQPRAIGKIVTAWRLARTKYRYHWMLGTICLLGGGLVVAAGGYVLLRSLHVAPNDMGMDQAAGLGGWVLSGLATGLVVIGIRSWQGQKMRTIVGVVWDLIAFWPRYAHPICPPPYGGRATLMLYDRAKYLVSKDGKKNIVVLSGHSQGSVVCAAAALLLDGDNNAPTEQLRLITYGSQLQWAFARLFPHYLGYTELECIHTKLCGRWWNVHRWTDPLGGHVLVWPDTAKTNYPMSAPGWQGFGPLRYQPIAETQCYERLGNEYRLRDPESVASRNDRPRSPLRGHSGYYLDPAFDDLVADLAATGDDGVEPDAPPDDLNPAERALIQSALDGVEHEFPELAPPNIRATVIRDLLTDGHGVRLKHARIVGSEALDLSGLVIPVGLRLDRCTLDCAIRAEGASIPWLQLVRCSVSGLFADQICVAGSIDLQGIETNTIRLCDSVVGADLDLHEAKLHNTDAGPGLWVNGIRVGGAFRFRDGEIRGGSSSDAFQHAQAQVTGDVWLHRTWVHHNDGPPLSAAELWGTVSVTPPANWWRNVRSVFAAR